MTQYNPTPEAGQTAKLRRFLDTPPCPLYTAFALRQPRITQPEGQLFVMFTPDEACDCASVEEILNDLVAENILRLEPGDRLWKLYCFRAAGHATDLRHRVYTKRKADGRLALVTFAAHNPAPASGPRNGSQGRVVRSGIARVADLDTAQLAQLISAIKQQIDAATQVCEEFDLSDIPSLDAQIAWLRERT